MKKSGYVKLEKTVISRLLAEHNEIHAIERHVTRYKRVFDKVYNGKDTLRSFRLCNGCKSYVKPDATNERKCVLFGKHDCVYNCGVTDDCQVPYCILCDRYHCKRDEAVTCSVCENMACELGRLIISDVVYCSIDCFDADCDKKRRKTE